MTSSASHTTTCEVATSRRPRLRAAPHVSRVDDPMSRTRESPLTATGWREALSTTTTSCSGVCDMIESSASPRNSVWWSHTATTTEIPGAGVGTRRRVRGPGALVDQDSGEGGPGFAGDAVLAEGLEADVIG